MTGVRFSLLRPHPFARVLALAAGAALLGACVALPQAPANAPLSASPLPPVPSVISMPLAVDLDEVAADAARSLPRPLLRRQWRRPVAVRQRSLQTSIAAGPGTCSITALDCLVQHSVHTVAAESVAMAEAEVTREWQLRRLALVMTGARLELQAQLEVVDDHRLPPQLVDPAPALNACGMAGGPARAEWRQDVYPDWGAGGALVLGTGPGSMRWLAPCPGGTLPEGAVPGAGAAESALAERLHEAVARQLRARLGQASLAARLARAWPELNAPRELRPGVWLLPRPGAVTVTPLAGEGRELRAALLAEAWPEVRRGERPAVALPPMPRPALGEVTAGGLHLALRGDIALADAEQALAARLTRSLRRVNGRPVRLQGVRLWGNGGDAVIALAFAEPVLAEVYLLARPVYDVRRNEVGFRDLALLPDSRRYLARTAPWLDHAGLLAALAAEARLGFDPALAGAMHGVRELSLAAGRDLTLQGGLQRVRPQALYFTQDRLVALVTLEARLALEARQ